MSKNIHSGRKKPRKLKIQKLSGDTIITNIRNLFRLKEENEAIKDNTTRDTKTLFEQQTKDYYKPVIASNFWSNNYTKYESNGDRNKALSIIEYLDEIKPYLKDIINNLKKSDK